MRPTSPKMPLVYCCGCCATGSKAPGLPPLPAQSGAEPDLASLLRNVHDSGPVEEALLESQTCQAYYINVAQSFCTNAARLLRPAGSWEAVVSTHAAASTAAAAHLACCCCCCCQPCTAVQLTANRAHNSCRQENCLQDLGLQLLLLLLFQECRLSSCDCCCRQLAVSCLLMLLQSVASLLPLLPQYCLCCYRIGHCHPYQAYRPALLQILLRLPAVLQSLKIACSQTHACCCCCCCWRCRCSCK